MCSRSVAARDSLRSRSFLLVGLLVVASVVLAGGAIALEQAGTTDQRVTQEQAAQDGAMVLENNTIEVELEADGDTHWTINWTFSLPAEESGDRFDALASEFESGEATAYLETLDSFRNASQQIDAARDRPIRITNETWSSNRTGTGENATGRLTLAFEWENFARTEGDRLIIDDALATAEHGAWLDELSADQELIVRIPEGYGVFDANVDPQDGALRWRGPMMFDGTTLQATFIGDNQTPEPRDESDVMLWGVVGLLVVAIAVVGVFLVNRRDSLLPGSTGSDDDGPPASGATPAAEQADPPESEPVPPDPADDQSREIDEELLSDEERVERLLEANGGRMKQAHIVRDTDWSNAKVSQLLSSMEDEDRIDKLRIGRENLISFTDVDVTEIEREE